MSETLYKFLGLIPRYADVSREFFQDYYESRHALLALQYFRGFAKYSRNHVIETLAGPEPAFDVLSEFWYDSIEELQKTQLLLDSDAGSLIRHDEQQFMHQAGVNSFAFEEHLLHGPERGYEAQCDKYVLAVKRRQGQAQTVFIKQLLTNSLSLADAWGLCRLTCCIAQQAQDRQAWDAFLFAWPNQSEDVSPNIPAMIADISGDVMLLKVRNFETDLSAVYARTPAAAGATSELSV